MTTELEAKIATVQPIRMMSQVEPLRILLIEDHETSAQLLCRLLSKRIPGVDCVIESTHKGGLLRAQQASPQFNIILLDLNLPDTKSADEVIESIPIFPKPVIVITDIDDPDSFIELKCYAYDAENFFSKKELRETVFATEGAELVKAITKAHFRCALPAQRREREARNGNGTKQS